MARDEAENRDTTSSNGGDEAWGTLEELLLACAVNRHGPNRWDSIARELQKRTFRNRNNHTNDNSFSNAAFTPLNCKRKYRDLKRRFNVNKEGGGAGDGAVDSGGDMDGGGADNGSDADSGRGELSCMVDELRKLRVDELKREVQRHDASIVSLQLKVKKLEEEREKNSKPEAEGGADLIIQAHGNGEGTREKRREKKRSPPDDAVVTVASGGAADETEDRSFNESNSTSHKDKNRKAAAEEERELKREPDEEGTEESDRVGEEYGVAPAKECSSSGGSGRLRNGRMEAETSGASLSDESAELRDSVSESKRDGKGAAKESSDVQSSASLSRRKRMGWRGGAGSSSADEQEAEEELSPANRRISVKSQPLIRFMKNLRSHKHGSVFERRLPSQETEKYRNLIRRHMDLETVQSRLDKGVYCDSHLRFYRDLLLVFTNAVQFYCKSSAVHAAAGELRKLVKQEIAQKTQKPELQLLDPVVKKPRSASTMIVGRRRAPTPPKTASVDDEEEENTGNGPVHKPSKAPLKKAINHQSNDSGYYDQRGANRGNEKGANVVLPVPKKLTRERSALGNNNNKTNCRADSTSTNNRKKKINKEPKQEDNSNNDSDGKKERRLEKAAMSTPATMMKKQGVANFLRRIKQNSPSRETTENGNDGGGGKEKAERDDKKRTGKRKEAAVNGKGSAAGQEKDEEEEEVEVEVVRRRTSGRRQAGKDQLEKDVGRRGGGRLPKRKAAEPPVAAGKRKREGGGGGEKEVGATAGGRQKKKSRR
ncbi:hypothetical protein Dimus_011679 [Dionaea muscipula]